MSTSTIGREDKKILIDAYVFERRMLLGCTLLIAVAAIVWIVSISTDHWVIISGGGGIYISETRRFFLSSHSGIWKICRYSSTPYPMLDPNIVRNFTTLTYQNVTRVNMLKSAIAKDEYIDEFTKGELSQPITEINKAFRRKLFGHWIKNDTEEFRNLKAIYHTLYLRNNTQKLSRKPVIQISPINATAVKDIFGKAMIKVLVNGTDVNIVMPIALQNALFDSWEEKPAVMAVTNLFLRDMEISILILDSEGTILQLTPPQPPKGNKRFANGYEYSPFKQCRYIDMFPSEQTIRNDPAIDDEILDYIRTEATFSCIALIIMIMGVVFSAYTFLNPRYMFKRLAGGIHFISSAACLVVIQVLIGSLNYQRNNLSFAFPAGAYVIYGYGVYLAWVVFSMNAFSGVMFMWYSKKKKGNKAPTDELAMADEPINIGR